MNLNLLKKGDEVRVQADEDPELETATVLKVNSRKTQALVFGEDDAPTGGFLMWLRPDEVIEKVEPEPVEIISPTIQNRIPTGMEADVIGAVRDVFETYERG